MQKVIAIAHQKGGVGKSTIACNLAVELGKSYPLSVIDLDYQKSISIFNEHRKEARLQPLNILLAHDKKELMELIDNADGIILIDSGGFDSDLNRIAMLGADMIITPLSHNLIEIYGLEAFKKILIELKEVKKDIRANILLNNINPQAIKAIDELKSYIKANEQFFHMLQTVLRRRVDFSKSFEIGKSVIEMDSSSKASLELKELIEEIKKILKQY
ncbi:MAG: ParA family protein [Campylobacteraceae bacterium]|nr:ParA family protein [Campylobacteraceae bacterium]